MKCPKCHYLSFDPEPRCRNCGYTLALDPDLEIQSNAEADPARELSDLVLREAESAEPPAPVRPRPTSRAAPPTPPVEGRRLSMPGPFDQLTVAPGAPAGPEADNTTEPSTSNAATPPAAAADSTDSTTPVTPRRQADRRPPVPPHTTELPLFVKELAEGAHEESFAVAPAAEPLAAPAPPAPTRRRATKSESHRQESVERPLGPLDRDLLEGLRHIEEKARRQAIADLDASARFGAAGPGRRTIAAAIDGGLLAGIAGGIVWTTLRWVGLDLARWTELPTAPLAAFVALVVAGYLFMFTAAGGQTAGKMLTGIRVVDSGAAAGRVTVRQALYRSLLAIPSVLAFGVGFLPALTGERLALHDRLTRTRVVRA